MLPAEPPENPEAFEACIADLDTIVAPNLSHWQHPRFFGYFPANAMLAGILGDLVSTGLGTVGLSWQSSPALSEIEEVVDRLGPPDGRPFARLGRRHQRHGVHQHARRDDFSARADDRLRARERRSSSRGRPLVVYASAGSHSCVEKGALLAGFGRENIRMVPLDEAQGMRPEALDSADRA